MLIFQNDMINLGNINYSEIHIKIQSLLHKLQPSQGQLEILFNKVKLKWNMTNTTTKYLQINLTR